MKQTQLIKALKQWLKEPGNSQAYLASKLGFRSSTTISQWIHRKGIPVKQVERVKSFIGVA